MRWVILAVAAAGVALMFVWGTDGEDQAAGESAHAGQVTLVATAPIEIDSITERGSFSGQLDADAADLASQVAGKLLSVNVRIGDEVTEKQVLARIDVSELAAQRVEARARASATAAAEKETIVELEAARRELERARGLLERDILSQQAFAARRDEAQALEARAAMSRAQHDQAAAHVRVLGERIANGTIVAPFDGVVTQRHLDPGTFVEPGAAVLRVVAREPLRVHFEVPQKRVGRFGEGASFVVRAPPTGDREIAGTVVGTAGEVDPASRVVRVEGTLTDPPPSWLPGMFVEVVVSLRTLDGATLVPARALVSRLRPGGDVQIGVFQPHAKTARWVPVTVVAREGDRAAVTGELDLERPVLVGGHTDLSDGARIRIAEESP